MVGLQLPNFGLLLILKFIVGSDPVIDLSLSLLVELLELGVLQKFQVKHLLFMICALKVPGLLLCENLVVEEVNLLLVLGVDSF